MNRYLALPLVLTVVLFAVVLLSHDTSGEPAERSTLAANVPPSPPLSIAEASQLVLEQWPTLGEFRFASRAMPMQRLYADIGQIVTTGVERDGADGSSFVTTLGIAARPLPEKLNKELKSSFHRTNESFPVHVDRHTRQIHVFADHRWKPYTEWRDTALPKYKELTGWEK